MTEAEPRSGWFAHEGRRLHFEDFGEGSQVLVYTNGLLLDTQLNRGMARALAERGHRVLLLDLLGHGQSDKLADVSAYRMDTYAREVVGLLDHLGIDQAAIGGISLGANVSLQVAVQFPERTKALVIEMPVLEWATPAAALTFVPLLLAMRYAGPVAAALTGLMRRVPSTPIAPLNSFVHAASTPPDVMAAILHGVLVGPVAPTANERRAIMAPSLVLGHGNDFIHPYSDAEGLADQIPGAQLERATSPFELRLHPDRLTGVISDFLDEVWSADRVQA